MFSFSFEFYYFDDIEVPAEEHESIDSHYFKGEGNIIKGGYFVVFVLDSESAVVLEDDS